MKTLKLLIPILLIAALSGCAGTTITTKKYAPDGVTLTEETSQPGSIMGPSSFDLGYTQMYQAHEIGKTARVTVLADSSKCPSGDTAAGAYCIALGKISGMVASVMDKFDVKAPTTGFDVLYKLTDSVVPVMGIAGIWQTAVAGYEKVGSRFGDNAKVENSMNPTYSNQTAIGAQPNPSTTIQGTAKPTVVEQPAPVIISDGVNVSQQLPATVTP